MNERTPGQAACEAYGDRWANQGPAHRQVWEDVAQAAIAVAQPAAQSASQRRRMDAQAAPEQDEQAFYAWAEYEGYDSQQGFEFSDMQHAFTCGMQAERDPQQALPVVVRALRTIAWGSTPDLKPVDASVVADKALAELRRLGYDEEAVSDAGIGDGQ